ncbi:MAG TPA: hypothetical protein VF530_13415 [Planctomycetota bacterium]
MRGPLVDADACEHRAHQRDPVVVRVPEVGEGSSGHGYDWLMRILVMIAMCGTLATLAGSQGQESATRAEVQALEKRLVRLERETPRRGEIQQVSSALESLRRRVEELNDSGAVLWLFGAFCALWAQQTGRNPWLWFFLGLIGSFITVIVLLVKNSQDRNRDRPSRMSGAAT